MLRRSPSFGLAFGAFVLITLAAGWTSDQEPSSAARLQAPPPLDTTFLKGFRWRSIGPDRGGRSIAVAGVRGRPREAYFGATGGGLWKTMDGGETWGPVTDGHIKSASVGAVAVSETNPDIVYIGMGETCIRGNIMSGDGVYKSTDGGRTWANIGFASSENIAKIRIHPTNPEIVFVAAFGKHGAPNPERGVFKSTDGGKTWKRVLFRNDRTAAIDFSIDRTNPNVMYAALWEAFRTEYTMSSGGAGSGLFKSTDGGETWTEITRNKGLPAGMIGRIGVAVSGANPNRVYALVENDNGGLFRSDDAGASWTVVNQNRAIRQRAFYYTHVYADPKNADVVYMQNTALFRSVDGGKTTTQLGGTHGDHHDLWIDPDDPAHIIDGNDGGGAVSLNTGQSWTDQDFPTEQFYHVATTKHLPYHVCGAQQDNSTLCTPSDWNLNAGGRGGRGGGGGEEAEGGAGRAGQAGAGRAGEAGRAGQAGGRAGQAPPPVDSTAGRAGAAGGRGGSGGAPTGAVPEPARGGMAVSYQAAGGEPGYIAPDPKDPDVFFSGTNNGGFMDRFNRRTGHRREVNPYPWHYSGEPALEIPERWQWTYPIIFSQADPNVLFTGSQRLWKTTNGGQSWQAISGDLTRHDPKTMGHSGGPITGDMNGPEVYAVIFSIGPSKRDANIIWTGSDDGLVHVTRDGGKTWANVTPPGMPEFGRVSQIDASAFDNGTAYVSVRRPLLDDKAPYIFRTRDFGQTWTKIVNGIKPNDYVHAVREDPKRKGLLYAGAQHGMYVSYDDGDSWQSLSLNLPDVPISDIIVETNDLVIATHGRGFYVLDNIGPLREYSPAVVAAEDAYLFAAAEGIRSTTPVALTYWLKKPARRVDIDVVDTNGRVVRSFTSDTTVRVDGARPSINAGVNRVSWDLRYNSATTFPGMILWGASTAGPAAAPGTYAVRLKVDGRDQTKPVTVKRNPMFTDVTDDDLKAQLALALRIRDKVTEANTAVIEIRRVKTEADERMKKNNDAKLKRAGGTLNTNLSDVEDDIYQVKNQSGQDPLNFPIKINNRLANLLRVVNSGDGRPIENAPVLLEEYVKQLKVQTDRLDVVIARDLAAFNKELVRLKLEPIKAPCVGRCGPIL